MIDAKDVDLIILICMVMLVWMCYVQQRSVTRLEAALFRRASYISRLQAQIRLLGETPWDELDD